MRARGSTECGGGEETREGGGWKRLHRLSAGQTQRLHNQRVIYCAFMLHQTDGGPKPQSGLGKCISFFQMKVMSMSRCHIKEISYIFSSSLELLILGMRIVPVHRQLGFDSQCSSITPAGFFFFMC